ncbi:MAG: hypothetical protein JWM80_5674 [Cyanobacteria bacterium RYN_339]|nr:hypothetical protein [Cyanobacteria bacterium RYN_339]
MNPILRSAFVLTLLAAGPAHARALNSVMANTLMPYKDSANGFELKRPGGWKVSRGDAAVAFYAEGDHPGEAMFVSRPTPTTKDLAALVKDAKATKGTEVSTVTLNGLPAVRVDLNAASGGKQYHARTYTLVSKKRLFNVTLRCLQADYATETVVFDNVAKSLKFAK